MPETGNELATMGSTAARCGQFNLRLRSVAVVKVSRWLAFRRCCGLLNFAKCDEYMSWASHKHEHAGQRASERGGASRDGQQAFVLDGPDDSLSSYQ